jgi:hypothetical protein
MSFSDSHSRLHTVAALLLLLFGVALVAHAFQSVIPPFRKYASPPAEQPTRGHTAQPEPG